jgi:hypothetical protein
MSRYIPSTYTASESSVAGNAIVYYTPVAINGSGKFFAIGYSGKREKNDFHYSFSSMEKLIAHVSLYLANMALSANANLIKKSEEKERNSKVSCEVGQIFKCSWGYDQTNVDYYQVTEVKGKKVTLRAIGAKTVNGTSGFMCCQVTPDKDNFLEGNMAETLTKIVKSDRYGNPTFSMQFGHLSLTSETEQAYCSWYA